MSEWKRKRFWAQAEAIAIDGVWQVRLDGRAIRTPAKSKMHLPTRAMAEAIAAEWEAQTDEVDPRTMPCTRYANSAIDRVAAHHAEVAGHVAAYGGSDLLCYRAEGPASLVDRQAAAWDPLLGWAETALGAPLRVTTGIVHVTQPQESLTRLHQRVAGLSCFELAALHDLTALSGSLVIGLAAAAGVSDPGSLWAASRVDETWQAEQWGWDEEAAEAAERKRGEFADALHFWTLCGTNS
jgi:chaperone required for assembly of F1-ATPase